MSHLDGKEGTRRVWWYKVWLKLRIFVGVFLPLILCNGSNAEEVERSWTSFDYFFLSRLCFMLMP